MSEPISAFAAYQGAVPKGGSTSKKSNNKKSGGIDAVGGSKGNAHKKHDSKQNNSLTKDRPKATAKNQADTKAKSGHKEKAPTARDKDVVNKAAPKATASTKNKGVANKAENTQPAKQQQKRHNTATNGRSVPNGIKERQIDNLVEQLLGESPSNPKTLTKAQQKKKQQLEYYLVHQLEKDDAEAGGEKHDTEESGSEEDYTSYEYSDEYTINSYSDDDDDEEEEGTASSETDEENVPVATSTTNTAAKKRKSNAIVKNDKKECEAKRSRQAANAFDKRKSLPSTSNTAVVLVAETTTDRAAKSKENRRHSVAITGNEVASAAKVGVKTVDAKVVKMEPLSPSSNVVKLNSIKEGEKVFNWLLSPLTVTEFLAKYWESGACLVKRKGSNYYSHLISFEAIDQMLIKNHVEFTKNIDITSYKNGERETLNPEGRAMPPVVWDHYGQGCSIRLLNPQTFLPELYLLNTTLQEYFHCLAGANAYLTPPNSQGFAPHYDDIEAFVLQIEGRKRWRLYKPRTLNEQLPRFSSKNFTQQEIGKPIFDEVLEPGDMLYFPRGTIHQACTEPGYHSLHITLSVYQKQSYADLFERMMPLVLQRAIESNLDMRRGLPLHTFQHAGIAYSDNDTKERAELLRKVTKLMGQCLQSVPLGEMMDAAVDQLAKKYQHEALPPHVLPTERTRTIFGSRSTTNERGECMCDYEIDERTNVRLLRANIIRLVQEEGTMRIYYYLDNSKEYCEYEPNFIEIEPEEAASVEVLIRSYPEYVGVSQLPLENEEHRVQMVTALWERGLLMTEKPFK